MTKGMKSKVYENDTTWISANEIVGKHFSAFILIMTGEFVRAELNN